VKHDVATARSRTPSRQGCGCAELFQEKPARQAPVIGSRRGSVGDPVQALA